MLTLVWIVPMVAALVAGWLAVQAILRQGPTINISFITAEGLEPGVSRLKYRDVEIGTVSAIGLSDDRSRVIVTARMRKQARSLLNADTRFWVVRPRVSASSVSGLGTLFSGAYIGVDAGSSTEERRDFVGLEVPPAVISGRPGTQYLLKSEKLGSLDIGSPVYFRQVEVGQVIAFEIDPDGRATSILVFVNSPYDKFVKARSRFWVASGIDASFNAAGFKLNTESMVSVLVGGIAFRTAPEALGDVQAEPSAHFELFADEASALRRPDTVVQSAVMVFRESVRGLAVGAPVDFRGIQVGEVRSFGFAPRRKNARPAILVRADLYPERLRSEDDDGERGSAQIAHMIERGLRAQLRQGNLLTGQLYVALDFVPGPAQVEGDAAGGELRIPTAPSAFTEIQATLAVIAKKLERLPIEELANDLRGTLRAVDATLAESQQLLASARQDLTPALQRALGDMRETLGAARATLADVRETLAADAPVPSELRGMMQEIGRAAEAVRTLAETLERQPEAVVRGKAGAP
jgi:paraquat-inducible protein B